MRELGKLYFDGQDLTEYGITISGDGTYNAPERDVKNYEIPGRNGELLIDNGRFKNIRVSYFANVEESLPDRSESLRNFLLSHAGSYYRLTDSYHPDEYRMATFKGPMEFDELGPMNEWGQVELEFDCKPQRFLTSGETPLDRISSSVAPLSIIVAQGYPKDIYNSTFITNAGALSYTQVPMTVVRLADYVGYKLVLYYSDTRVMQDRPIVGGTMSGNPTNGAGGSFSYGSFVDLYDASVVFEDDILSDYAAFETPLYFEIYDGDTLVASIFPTTVTVTNPTLYDAKPLLKIAYDQDLENQPAICINGSTIYLSCDAGTVINGQHVDIGSFYIDCETMNAYANLEALTRPYNMNPDVYIPNDITLKPGANEVKLNNKIQYLEIIPRWWKI